MLKHVFTYPLSCLLLLSAAFTGCQSPPTANVNRLSHSPLQHGLILAGQTEASGQVTLQFNLRRKTDMGFKTQAACSIDAHLDHLRVYLIDGTSTFGSVAPFSPGAIEGQVIPNASTFYTIGKHQLASPTGSQLITLSNVEAGTYYVAVSAHDGSNTNITHTTGSGSAATINGEPIFVSDGGGDPSNPGRVQVGDGPTYAIQIGPAPLTVSVDLSDSVCS